MINYGKKGYKIALIALVFALIAISLGGTNGLNGINGTNGVNQSDNTKVNKSGDILTGDLTGLYNGNQTDMSISYGFGELFSRDISTGNYSRIGVYPDGLILEASDGTYNSMSINSSMTQFTNDVDIGGNNITNCANCASPAISDNTKVNKSGDNLSGNINMGNFDIKNVSALNIKSGIINGTVSSLNRSIQNMSMLLTGYNGGFMIGRNGKEAGAFSAYINPSYTATYMFVYANRYWDDSLTLKDTSFPGLYGSGFVVAGTSTDSYLQWVYSPPNSVNSQIEAFKVNKNGNLTITGSVNSMQTFSGNMIISGLSGTGNAYACLDSSGKIYRSLSACV